MSKQSRNSPYPIVRKFPHRLEQIYYKSYNWVQNRLWPIPTSIFTALCIASGAIHYKYSYNLFSKFLLLNNFENIQLALSSFLSIYLPVLSLRAILKYTYFTYKGFLFESPKKPSLLTKIWGFTRLILKKSPICLESCDRLLPNLPVPCLQFTIDEYLSSMKHILSKNEFEEISQQAKLFLLNEGSRLQKYAQLYSLFSDNYVTPFWEKYAYLYGRYPLLINSSVAHVDLFKNNEATQAHRAARITFIEATSHLAIDKQQYKPLGDGLVCTRHYKKMYAVTRVPGKTCDSLKRHGIQKHIVVILRGCFYKVQICDDKNMMFNLEQLTKIFHELITRNEREDGILAKIAALTVDERDKWYDNRTKYFLNNCKNSEALSVIESAIFVLSLDQNEDYGYDEKNPKILSNFLLNMLAGDGKNRWADKSLNYVCSKNARCGGTTEHSIADGAEFDHIMENFVYFDLNVLGYKSVEEQKQLAQISENERNSLKFGEKIQFELCDSSMEQEIERCYNKHLESKNDVDMHAMAFRDFGKGQIKKFGCSPDAFVQMVLQLAIYKERGEFTLTYEPASIRFFANSRTETLRTVSDQSCEFVYAMLNENESKAKRIELLRRACETHVEKNKKCMIGKGIDRHLFVLYVLSKATNTTSKFLETYISQKWKLCTSHVPNVTNQVDEDKCIDDTWLGACFGAVAHDGYGVCYRFGGNHSILINISSYHSCSSTDSSNFASTLNQCLHEVAELFN